MKKVYVKLPSVVNAKERFRNSEDYEFVYEEDKDAQIVIGNLSEEKLKEFKNLEWMQSPAVGIENYLRKGVLREGVILTKATDIHTEEVAEHTLAVLLMMVKKLYLYRDDQKKQLWKRENL